jgi:hypothetical protein
MYDLYAYSAYEAGEKLQEIDNSNSLVLSVPFRLDMEPELLYYADRKGWVIAPDKMSVEIIEDYKLRGVKYLVMTDILYLTPELEDYIFSRKSYTSDNYIIVET